MFALALSGLDVVAAGPPPSVAQMFLTVTTILWGILMMFGGVTSMLASFWPDRITGLLLERIALFAVGGACWVYAACLYAVYDVSSVGYLNLTTFLAIGAACFWRIRHVSGELKTLSRWIGWRED